MPTVNLQVSAGEDDCYDRHDGNDFDRTAAYTAAHAGSYPAIWTGGHRFASVNIPQGATILSAVVTVKAYDTTNDDPNCDIHAEAVDNSVGFGSDGDGDVIARPLTAASVTWFDTGLGTSPVQTPDITDVIQEIVDRAGWIEGNALTLLFVGNDASAHRIRMTSYDGDPANAMKLDIEYEAAGVDPIEASGTDTPSGVHTAVITPLPYAGESDSSGVVTFLEPQDFSVGGADTPTGALVTAKSHIVSVGGADTPTGAVSVVAQVMFDGVSTSSGSILARVNALLGGSDTPSGVLATVRHLFLGGSDTPSGSLTHLLTASFSGASASSGAFSFFRPALKAVGRMRALITDRDGTKRGNILS